MLRPDAHPAAVPQADHRQRWPALFKLAGKPLHEIGQRLPIGPITYEVLTHSGFMLPMPDPVMARRAVKEFLTTPTDWYMHLAAALRRCTCGSRCGASTCRPASSPGSSTCSPRRRHEDGVASGSPAPPTRSCAPRTSSRWRSPTRSTRRCSTCWTACPSRPRSLGSSRMMRLATLIARSTLRPGRMRRRLRRVRPASRPARRPAPASRRRRPRPARRPRRPPLVRDPARVRATEGHRHRSRATSRCPWGDRVPPRRLRAGHRARQRPGAAGDREVGARGRPGRRRPGRG